MSKQVIKAIETHYNGCRFRSRLEARYAVFFDKLGLRWEYEQEGYEFEGTRYLPDFAIYFFGKYKKFVEIKPSTTKVSPVHLYLAGKMDDWRHELDTHGCFRTGPDENMKHDRGLHGMFDCQEKEIADSCIEGINACDLLFAWINSPDSYGTFAEIGIAKGLNKRVCAGFSHSVIKQVANKSNYAYDKPTHDLWLIEELCERQYSPRRS